MYCRKTFPIKKKKHLRRPPSPVLITDTVAIVTAASFYSCEGHRLSLKFSVNPFIFFQSSSIHLAVAFIFLLPSHFRPWWPLLVISHLPLLPGAPPVFYFHSRSLHPGVLCPFAFPCFQPCFVILFFFIPPPLIFLLIYSLWSLIASMCLLIFFFFS